MKAEPISNFEDDLLSYYRKYNLPHARFECRACDRWGVVLTAPNFCPWCGAKAEGAEGHADTP